MKKHKTKPKQLNCTIDDIDVISYKVSVTNDYGCGIVDQHNETRYKVVDKYTGKVVDDAQGYGYKTKQNAYKAIYYKTHKNEIDIKKEVANKIINEHFDVLNKASDCVAEEYLIAFKDGEPLKKSVAFDIFANAIKDIDDKLYSSLSADEMKTIFKIMT